MAGWSGVPDISRRAPGRVSGSALEIMTEEHRCQLKRLDRSSSCDAACSLRNRKPTGLLLSSPKMGSAPVRAHLQFPAFRRAAARRQAAPWISGPTARRQAAALQDRIERLQETEMRPAGDDVKFTLYRRGVLLCFRPLSPCKRPRNLLPSASSLPLAASLCAVRQASVTCWPPKARSKSVGRPKTNWWLKVTRNRSSVRCRSVYVKPTHQPKLRPAGEPLSRPASD